MVMVAMIVIVYQPCNTTYQTSQYRDLQLPQYPHSCCDAISSDLKGCLPNLTFADE